MLITGLAFGELFGAVATWSIGARFEYRTVALRCTLTLPEDSEKFSPYPDLFHLFGTVALLIRFAEGLAPRKVRYRRFERLDLEKPPVCLQKSIFDQISNRDAILFIIV